MHFLGALTLFLATAQAAVTSQDLVNKLTQFKNDARHLQQSARRISPMDATLAEFGMGATYTCIKGFKEVVNDASVFAGTLGGTPIFGGQDATNIYNAYTAFVEDHVELFRILTRHAKLFARPADMVGKGMHDSLVDVQGIMGALGGFLLGQVPPLSSQIAVQKDKVDASLTTCLDSWRRVCGRACRGKEGD